MARAHALPAIALFLIALAGCAPHPPDLSRATGVVELPAGTLLLHHPLTIPGGAHDFEIRGHPSGSTLKAAPDFQGRAMIVAKGAHRLRLDAFRIEGNRPSRPARMGLPPSDVSFARFYNDNGILIENSEHVSIRDVSFREVANYPVLVSASSHVRLDSLHIEDCGGLGTSGRNNAGGGVLLEEGTADFEVRRSTVRRVRGNGIWTHSNYRSPRNANGIIAQNVVEDVARDAIQIGHATNVRVERNTGARIGYPVDLVDMLAVAIPVALDTGGNVDRSAYVGNRFTEVNGQCIDLDGFHDGEVRDNTCVSTGSYEQYPFAQVGIVFGNSNPDMTPENVTITGNVIDGAGYGGIFLIGAHHVLTGNRFLNLNRNHCTGDMTQARCNYAPDQPGLLRSGIYLGHGAARPAETAGNRIDGNQIAGFGMDKWCIEAAPGVSLARNQVGRNDCTARDTPR